jgi:hypothetical protein
MQKNCEKFENFHKTFEITKLGQKNCNYDTLFINSNDNGHIGISLRGKTRGSYFFTKIDFCLEFALNGMKMCLFKFLS